MKSNFFILFPLLALGIYIGSLGNKSVWIFFSLFSIVALVWIFAAYKGRISKEWFFWLLVLLGAVVIGQFNLGKQQIWLEPCKGDFDSAVISIQKLNFDQRAIVKLASSKHKVAVHLPLELKIEPGDKLHFFGSIMQPDKAPNPGVFSYQDFLFQQGVFGVSYPTEYSVQTGKISMLSSFRSKLRHNISKYVKDPSLVLGLTLGDRDALSSERKETWRKLGISHLLAISGMHVGFISLGIGFVVQKLPVRPLFRLIMIQLILLAYILMAGTGASAWRALLVSILGSYASFKELRIDPLHIWSVVGSLMLLAQPHMLFNQGFCLSFIASGGILLWSHFSDFRFKSKIINYFVGSLLISVVAQVSLTPLLLHYFGEISLLAPIATLVFVPLVIVLLLGGLGVSLGLGSIGLGALINQVMLIVESLENLLAPYSWQWTPTNLGTIELGLVWILFFYAGWRLRRPRIITPKVSYCHLAICSAVVFFLISLPPVLLRPMEITAVNVGQGDCYYIRTPSGRHLLIDGGGDSPYWQERGRNVGKDRLLPYLKHRGVTKIDYVILSHPHEDHLFGLLAVLEELDVGMVIDNGHSHNTPTYERYLDLILEKDIPYHIAKRGDLLKLGDGITLRVLYPKKVRESISSEHNNNSLLLLLKYGGIRLMFTGDLEKPVLQDLARDSTMDLRAHLLKVPHHGSAGSLVEEFYERVNPKWAVISVGPNSFGHPSEEVLKFLNDRNIRWKTTLDGPKTFTIWWGLWGRFKYTVS